MNHCTKTIQMLTAGFIIQNLPLALAVNALTINLFLDYTYHNYFIILILFNIKKVNDFVSAQNIKSSH